MRVWGGVVAALLVLICAASAKAAVVQRYVSVAGTGNACTPSEPCSLRYAAANSATGDEVIVAAGTYSATPPIRVPDGSENVYIHGDRAGPMPRIDATVSEFPPIVFEDTGGRLSYLEVVNVADSGYGASCLLEGTLERVKLVVQGQDAIGLFQGPGCYLRDSLVLAEGPGAVALYTTDNETSEAEVTEDRNVTAVARGPNSIGAWLNFLGVGPIFKLSLMLRNSIAKGERYDLYGTGSATLSHYKSQIFPSNSNFASVGVPDPLRVEFKDGGGNRNAAPLFVDPTHGDYREAEGSPTIDGGAAQEVGRLDLAGGPRIIGRAPDMGAFEFVPSPAPPSAKTIGRLRALSLEPEKFHPFLPGHGNKPPRPRGTTVSYRLSAAGHVRFTVEEKTVGRVVKGKCLRKTRFNRTGKKCPLILPLRGSLGRKGKAGGNRFRFSGYFAGKPLPQGRYRLVGTAGGVTKRARFTILK
jgi:hypothetical protein